MSPPFFPVTAETDEPAAIIFFRALKMHPDQRDGFLNQECGADMALRTDVESMLRDHENAGSFLSVIAPAGELQTELGRLVSEEDGGMIGPYKLLQQIGEGGCGVVWMAEQTEPVRRRVALKVIKLGMDTKQVIARFEAERQALALMDHPNIARVLDAGATDAGRPYFVMELVRGIRITNYCDQNNLPTEKRLALFTQVCQAVQHAHQKGIIHRDIKPSNILVTLHDGVPVPKVIDFGIAKATTGQQLTDKTIFTAFEQFIGTPAYMSPEQAEMSGLDIDTRSDIYALGVLLYELLTGQTPFDARDLLASGLDAMRRTIREQEPPRPSTRLSTMLAADQTTVAKHHQTEAGKLTHSLRGDLDWIVMKALEKDRTRRYESASSLALDIQRHLNDEPVTARPPGNLYRFRKLVRRNKLAFAAASAVVAALLIGLGVSTWMFFKEKHARERAVAAEQEQGRLRQLAETQEKMATAESTKSLHVAKFLKDMLEGVGPSVALGRDTKMLREILDKTAKRVGKDLKEQPAIEAELRNTIGHVYLKLGDFATAVAMHREALALRSKLFGDEHPDVTQSLNNLAVALEWQGKPDEAEVLHRKALAMYIKRLGHEGSTVAESLNNLGSALIAQGKLADAEALYQEALAIHAKKCGNTCPNAAFVRYNLGLIRLRDGRLAEAETMLREALALRRRHYSRGHPQVADSLQSLVVVLLRQGSQGKWAEAEDFGREALAMERELYGSEDPEVLIKLRQLGYLLKEQNKLAEAERIFREALETRRKVLGREHPNVVQSLRDLAGVIMAQGKLAEAETMLSEVLAADRNAESVTPEELERVVLDLADTLYRQNKYADAETLYREAAGRRRNRLPAGDDDVIGANASLARLLADRAWSERGSHSDVRKLKPDITERAREAERLLRECLAVRLRTRDPAHWRIPEERSRLGGALVSVAATDAVLTSEARLAKLSEAEALLLEGNEVLQASEEAAGKYKRDSLTRIVRLYEAWDKPHKAAEWQKKLDDFNKAEANRDTGEKDFSPESLRDMLSQAAERLATILKSQPEAEATLRHFMGKVYSSLGDYGKAGAMWTQALALRRKIFGNEHVDVGKSLHNLANVRRQQGKLAEAESMHREALTMWRNLLGSEHPLVARALNNLASDLREQGKPDEAEILHREALAMGRKLHGGDHPDVAASLNNLGNALRDLDRLEEAGKTIRQALAMTRTLLGDEHPDVAIPLYNLALTLERQGKPVEAEASFREAIAIRRKLPGNEYPDLVQWLWDLGHLLRDHDKPAGAEPLYREVLAFARKSWSAQAVQEAMIALAEVLYRQDKFAEAEPLYREAMESRKARQSAEHIDTIGCMASLARVLTDWAWSERDSLSDIQHAKPEIAERAREAERLLRECLALRQKGPEAGPWRTTGDVPNRLGSALLSVAVTDPALTSEARVAKLAEAEALLLEGNEVLHASEEVAGKYKRDSLTRIVRLYQAWDKKGKADAWQKKLDEFKEAEAKPVDGEKDDSPGQ